MPSSAVQSAISSPQKSTPASSPPPSDMDTDTKADGVSDAMQAEEGRMRAQREKNEAKRDAQLERERQEDLKSGREVLDKKFQQLEFLMNKSKVSDPKSTIRPMRFNRSVSLATSVGSC